MTWYQVAALMRSAAAESVQTPWTWYASIVMAILAAIVFAFFLFNTFRRRSHEIRNRNRRIGMPGVNRLRRNDGEANRQHV